MRQDGGRDRVAAQISCGARRYNRTSGHLTMIVKIELPDELVEELHRSSQAQNLTPDQYASEMLYQLLAERSLV